MSKYTLYRNFMSLIKHPFKMPRFFSDFSAYNKANTNPDFKASLKNSYICLDDWGAHAGSTGIYFYQDLWAARTGQQHLLFVAKNDVQEYIRV